MNATGAGGVLRRFLVLRVLRWLPTGLLKPVLVLLLLDRGFSLGQVGLIMAAQGFMVLLLELPTGGLTDALGRRPVLLFATVVNFCAVALLVTADSPPALVIVFALQGVYRALESGPLDAWYVDATQAADPYADVERGLFRGGAALGTAVGAGALTSGGLVALGPLGGVDALVLPLLANLALEAVHIAAIAVLMTEARPGRGMAALRRSVHATPYVMGKSVRLVWGSSALTTLVGVELLWGFGMTAFETPSSSFVLVIKSAISFNSCLPFSITTPVPAALIIIVSFPASPHAITSSMDNPKCLARYCRPSPLSQPN